VNRNIKKLATVIVALAVGLALSGCGGKTITRQITVAGNVAWTDTGIEVQAQQRLVVNAAGEVLANAENKTSPDGFAARPEWRKFNLVAEAHHMALIGKIGTTGKPFLVGAAFRGPAPATGRLFLGINDRDIANNKGSFKATVTVR
jgi:hypothetical protein